MQVQLFNKGRYEESYALKGGIMRLTAVSRTPEKPMLCDVTIDMIPGTKYTAKETRS